MRYLLIVVLGIFITPAFSQSPSPSASPPATGQQEQAGPQTPTPPASSPVPGELNTFLLCRSICLSGMRKKLGGADRQAFTTCADAGLCNEAYPPVAKSEPYFGPFDKLFNDFVYGGRRNIEGGT